MSAVRLDKWLFCPNQMSPMALLQSVVHPSAVLRQICPLENQGLAVCVRRAGQTAASEAAAT